MASNGGRKVTTAECAPNEFGVFVENGIVFCRVNDGPHMEATRDEVIKALNAGPCVRVSPAERHFTIGLQPGWTLRDIEHGIARFYAESHGAERLPVSYLTFGSVAQRRLYLGLLAESHRQSLAFETYGYAPLFVSPSVSAETVRVTFTAKAAECP